MALSGAMRVVRRVTWLPGLTCWLVLTLLASNVVHAHPASGIWLVNRPGDDASDGDLATHQGTLRFALTHAASGDQVVFGDVGADTIFIGSPLTVPDGVAVGGRRDQECGRYNMPLANIEDAPLNSLDPILTLGAGSSLHNVAIGGGRISVRITGADVDVCGVALGIIYDGEGNPTILPPTSLALSIDGARATIRRNYIGRFVVVGTHGSDTRIGDTLDGSGDSNDGIRSAAVTVLADVTGAAQRVTIRDPFPRGLFGLVKPGVPGGDDDPTHANNWAQTPTIASARTSDGVTVQINGTANPLSLVDIYLDNQVTITRGTPIMADAAGAFSFNGPLPVPGAQVTAIAASTLADAAHPNRVGSSSEWSGATAVISASAEPLLSSLGSVADLSGPEQGPAHHGDVLRFSVTMTNVGPVDVTNIRSTVFQTPPAVSVWVGSGKVQGDGTGFIAGDDGFSGGTLAPGKTAVYTLDAVVKPDAPAGMAVFSLEVNGDGIVSTPVIGRMRIVVDPAPASQPRAWVPLVVR